MSDTVATWPDDSNMNVIMEMLQNTDTPPSDLQAREVSAIRVRCEAEILDIDAQIARLQTTIADLASKRSQKRDCANACTLVLSPARRLPQEVLETIFFLSLPKPRTPDPNEAPLSLTRVCSLWRRVAMAQSELWSELCLCANITEDVEGQNIANVIHLWFNSARQRTLSFFFQASTEDEVTLPTSITEKIIAHINRFRTLELEADSYRMFTHLLRLPLGRMDELEHLVLRFSFPDVVNYISIFESTPKIRRLSLCIFENFATHLRVPWSQLTHLNMIDTLLVGDQWRTLLCKCHHLTVGAFWISVVISTIPVPAGQPIALPHLRDLRIKSEIGGFLLDELELPALVRVTYKLNSYGHLRFSPLVTQLCKLQSLTLAFSERVAMDDVLALLGDMPSSLTHLRLELAGDYRVLCEGLIRCENEHGEVSERVPRLETLEVGLGKKEGGRNFDVESFMGMIRSRQVSYGPRSHPVCLKNVVLHLGGGASGANDSEQPLWENIPEEFMHTRQIGEVAFSVERDSNRGIWLDDDPREWV